MSVEAVTPGMSVMEFFGPGNRDPKGRFGRRSRKRQRLEEVIEGDFHSCPTFSSCEVNTNE